MKRAFSLIELSIVIVIIGLVVGGISVGQSVLRNAGLNEVVTDYAIYQSALQNFMDKYSELPGDMSRATQVWGQQAAGAACKTTASTDIATCDGDGNGQLAYNYANSNEIFRAWQHLANAGMIEGSYTGVKRAGATDERAFDPGTNAPAVSLDDTGFSFRTFGDMSADTNWYDGYYGTIFIIGATYNEINNWTATFTPEEAKNIDNKLDDGLPPSGSFRTTTPNWVATADCATSASEATAEYKLSVTSKACSLVVITGF